VQRSRNGRLADIRGRSDDATARDSATREGLEERPARGADATAGVVNPRARQRAFAIGIVRDAEHREDPLAELKELLRTAGVATAGELTQARSEPDPDRYLGRGKLTELKREIAAADANLIACDDELVPRQERNLEQELGVPVIDRTAVILDIFADHAHTAEGKLQVELAQLEYNLARMRGLWTHLERLGAGRIDGGIGTRGPGESQIETDRRLARDRITALRRRLRGVERNRAIMRTQRERAALPSVALAGYTNAGKSTLLNALTGAGVSVGERLFHTLDPTTRAFTHDGRRYLLTDTVGFIRKLPHQLVEAFKATLEETVLADLILHVVDGSEPAAERADSIAAADALLDEIGAGASPRLLVMNKIDLVDEDERRELALRHPEAVLVCAETGEGLEVLRSRIADSIGATLTRVELLVPFDAGDRLSELHEIAGDLERQDRQDGVLVRARLPAAHADRFSDLDVNGRGGRPPGRVPAGGD
jgi:GTP-binding protein HflX